MNKMIERKKSKKGFTLIELIVVLAILVVLAAIALPTFNGLIDESRQEVAHANARTVYTAAVAYLALHPDATSIGISEIGGYLGDEFGSTATTDITITGIGVSDGKVTGVNIKMPGNGKTGKYPTSYTYSAGSGS